MPFCKAQNESGVIASVHLIRAIVTTWRAMDRFELLNLCKDLVFCFVRQMAVCSHTIEITQSHCDELKEGRDRNSPDRDDLFSQKQLDETFKVVSTWMDQTHYRPKDVMSLGKELEVPHALNKLYYICVFI